MASIRLAHTKSLLKIAFVCNSLEWTFRKLLVPRSFRTLFSTFSLTLLNFFQFLRHLFSLHPSSIFFFSKNAFWWESRNHYTAEEFLISFSKPCLLCLIFCFSSDWVNVVGDGLIESIFNRKVRAIAKGHSGNCTAKKRGEKEGRQRRIHSIRNIFRQRRRGDDIEKRPWRISPWFFAFYCKTVMRISRIS